LEYVKLGATGLDVSRLCLGCMTYGTKEWREWIQEEDVARSHFERALEAGVNFFDTADMYSRGESERVTGKLLGEMARRDEIVLATKVFFPLREGPNQQGLSRKRILDACHASLKRLGMDYIDLYQIHRYDARTPLEETLEALDSLIRSGMVRYLGASSMAAWQFARALTMAGERGWHRFVSMQNHYNLIYREEERDMIPLCVEEGVGVIPWSPLARGFLAGNRTREEHEPTERARTDEYGRNLYYTEDDFKVVDAVRSVAEARGVSCAQISLAWILQTPGVTSPIVGATKLEHLEEAIAALEVRLDAEEVEKLEAPYTPHRVLGHRPPSVR